jgi:hypothetical protein
MESIGSDCRLQIRIAVPEGISEIDGFLTINEAPGCGPIGFECCELHEAVLA